MKIYFCCLFFQSSQGQLKSGRKIFWGKRNLILDILIIKTSVTKKDLNLLTWSKNLWYRPSFFHILKEITNYKCLNFISRTVRHWQRWSCDCFWPVRTPYTFLSCHYSFRPVRRPELVKYFLPRLHPSTTWTRRWSTPSLTTSSGSSSSGTRPSARALSWGTSRTGRSRRCPIPPSGSTSLLACYAFVMVQQSSSSCGTLPDRYLLFMTFLAI